MDEKALVIAKEWLANRADEIASGDTVLLNAPKIESLARALLQAAEEMERAKDAHAALAAAAAELSAANLNWNNTGSGEAEGRLNRAEKSFADALQRALSTKEPTK